MDADEKETYLPTIDAKDAYTVNEIQELYIRTSGSVEQFAELHRLNPMALSKFVREGKWDELRAARAEEAIETLKIREIAELQEIIELEYKKLKILMKQDDQVIAELVAHYERYGHHFHVDQRTGEILRGADGKGIPLKVPRSIKPHFEGIAELQDRLEARIQARQTPREEKEVKSEQAKSDIDALFTIVGEDAKNG